MNGFGRNPDLRRRFSDRGGRLLTASLLLTLAIACVAWSSAGAMPAKHGRHHHHHKPKPGPRGPRGATGPQGPAGPAGAGSIALTYVSATQPIPANSEAVKGVPCPPGQYATGGGVSSDGVFNQVYLLAGVPTSNTGAWYGAVDNRDDATHNYTAWGVCTPPSTVTQPPKPQAAGRSVRAKAGPPGPQGPRGATGPQGPPGPNGTGQLSLTYVTKNVTPQANGNASGTATCPAGQHVTGGGVSSPADFQQQWITDSAPSAGGTGWTAAVDTFGPSQQFVVHAICTTSTVTTMKFKSLAAARRFFAREPAAKRGPRGPRGRRGATGPQGTPGPSTSLSTIPLTYVLAEDVPAPHGTQSAGDVQCPAGQNLTGGGVSPDGLHNENAVNSLFPKDPGTWSAAVDNSGQANGESFDVIGVCTPSTVTKR